MYGAERDLQQARSLLEEVKNILAFPRHIPYLRDFELPKTGREPMRAHDLLLDSIVTSTQALYRQQGRVPEER